MPTGQTVQVAAYESSSLKVPAGQSLQTVSTDFVQADDCRWPTPQVAQVTQLLAPALTATLPLAHAWQPELPSTTPEKVPAAHSLQLTSAVSEHVLATPKPSPQVLQVLHELWPAVPCQVLPARHDSHGSCDTTPLAEPLAHVSHTVFAVAEQAVSRPLPTGQSLHVTHELWPTSVWYVLVGQPLQAA